MKIEPPPKLSEQVVSRAFAKHPQIPSVELEGRYMPWDELRRRPAPAGLSHPEWWALLKLARLNVSRELPLHGHQAAGFTFAMTDTVQRLVHEIDRDASGRIELPEDVTNRETRDRYIVDSLIEEAFRSSQLEGASTTRAVAKEMIRAHRAPRTVSERMILNNFRAMEWVREHRDEPITLARVFELHSIVTAETLDDPDGGGRFRTAAEEVVVTGDDGEVVHRPPAADSLPARASLMCEFANATTPSAPFVHPVVRAILLHFWLAYDHPFVDGNGRTARALFYWSMLKQGYWLTEFISISGAIRKARTQYDDAFVFAETDGNDTTYFVLNQLKMLRVAIDALFATLKKKAHEVRELDDRLRGRDDLNHRQLAVLSHVLRHPDAQLTIEGHQTSHGVVYQTARTDLLDLTKRGFLAQTKRGKRMIFSAASDVQRRLRPSP